MKYAELMNLPQQEREEVARSLTDEEMADLWDEKPYHGAGLTDKEDRKYFDDLEELHEYAREYLVPMTRLYEADAMASHEGAHAECALALGAVTVRYYVLDVMHETTRNSVFVEHFNPNPLPNLAWAAISMHPHNATESLTDMGNIRSYGYRSRDHVTRRILRWNEQDNGLYIPEPQKTPVTYL